MDAALAFLACYIQEVWPILQSSLRYVTDPKYFHQTPWSGITSLPISISCIFLRKLKITAHEHWRFDCSMSKLNSLEQNNNNDAEDDAWPLWDKTAYKKTQQQQKSYVISNSEVRPGGISALKPLMEYRSTITSRPSLAKLLHYYADISLNLPRSPKQKSNSWCLYTVIFNFLNSLSSKSAVFCETYMSDEKFSTKVSYSDLLGLHSKISNAVETATKEKCVLYYYRW